MVLESGRQSRLTQAERMRALRNQMGIEDPGGFGSQFSPEAPGSFSAGGGQARVPGMGEAGIFTESQRPGFASYEETDWKSGDLPPGAERPKSIDFGAPYEQDLSTTSGKILAVPKVAAHGAKIAVQIGERGLKKTGIIPTPTEELIVHEWRKDGKNKIKDVEQAKRRKDAVEKAGKSVRSVDKKPVKLALKKIGRVCFDWGIPPRDLEKLHEAVVSKVLDPLKFIDKVGEKLVLPTERTLGLMVAGEAAGRQAEAALLPAWELYKDEAVKELLGFETRKAMGEYPPETQKAAADFVEKFGMRAEVLLEVSQNNDLFPMMRACFEIIGEGKVKGESKEITTERLAKIFQKAPPEVKQAYRGMQTKLNGMGVSFGDFLQDLFTAVTVESAGEGKAPRRGIVSAVYLLEKKAPGSSSLARQLISLSGENEKRKKVLSSGSFDELVKQAVRNDPEGERARVVLTKFSRLARKELAEAGLAYLEVLEKISGPLDLEKAKKSLGQSTISGLAPHRLVYRIMDGRTQIMSNRDLHLVYDDLEEDYVPRITLISGLQGGLEVLTSIDSTVRVGKSTFLSRLEQGYSVIEDLERAWRDEIFPEKRREGEKTVVPQPLWEPAVLAVAAECLDLTPEQRIKRALVLSQPEALMELKELLAVLQTEAAGKINRDTDKFLMRVWAAAGEVLKNIPLGRFGELPTEFSKAIGNNFGRLAASSLPHLREPAETRTPESVTSQHRMAEITLAIAGQVLKDVPPEMIMDVLEPIADEIKKRPIVEVLKNDDLVGLLTSVFKNKNLARPEFGREKQAASLILAEILESVITNLIPTRNKEAKDTILDRGIQKNIIAIINALPSSSPVIEDPYSVPIEKQDQYFPGLFLSKMISAKGIDRPYRLYPQISRLLLDLNETPPVTREQMAGYLQKVLMKGIFATIQQEKARMKQDIDKLQKSYDGLRLIESGESGEITVGDAQFESRTAGAAVNEWLSGLRAGQQSIADFWLFFENLWRKSTMRGELVYNREGDWQIEYSPHITNKRMLRVDRFLKNNEDFLGLVKEKLGIMNFAKIAPREAVAQMLSLVEDDEDSGIWTPAVLEDDEEMREVFQQLKKIISQMPKGSRN